MNKEKAKRFCKEHWGQIVTATGLLVVGGIVGAKVTTKLNYIPNEYVSSFLKELDKLSYGIKGCAAWHIRSNDYQYSLKDLGNVGEDIIKGSHGRLVPESEVIGIFVQSKLLQN